MERVNVYHRKDGRWEGRIPRGKRKDGKRKYQYILARTRADVIDKMAEISRNEQPTGKCHKTVDALFNEWFRSVQHLVKESTSANYVMKAEKHILPIFGNKLVSSIAPNETLQYHLGAAHGTWDRKQCALPTVRLRCIVRLKTARASIRSLCKMIIRLQSRIPLQSLHLHLHRRSDFQCIHLTTQAMQTSLKIKHLQKELKLFSV